MEKEKNAADYSSPSLNKNEHTSRLEIRSPFPPICFLLELLRKREEGGGGGHGWRGGRGDVVAEKAKFPWSSMRSATANSRWCCFLDFLFFN
ncbi:hypothetical protein NC651_018544 [Populus alba x Populus x berolinensis]|nr:hypothetical protein NC651_018544 [Populus alba x Populus x berolinensis]